MASGHHAALPAESRGALRFGASDGCTVQLLDDHLLRDSDSLEAAVVYLLPAPIEDTILALRDRLALTAPPGEQLTPHLTILHLGQQKATDLLGLHKRLKRTEIPELTFTGLGFFHGDGGLTNIHLKVGPRPPLVDVQQSMIDSAQDLQRLRFSTYVGEMFDPHVTLWDQARLDLPASALRQMFDLPDQSFRLSELVLIGRRSE